MLINKNKLLNNVNHNVYYRLNTKENKLPSRLSSSTTAAVIIGCKDDNSVAYGLRFGDLIISPHNIPYVF